MEATVSVRRVREFMTASPIHVSPRTRLPDAHLLMRESKVRHLVVLDAGHLVGVLSQRDIYLMETLQAAEPQEALVEEAMHPDPYAVSAETAIEEVARTMWRERHGSAIVIEGDEVLGIFTTTDALRALAEILASNEIPASP
jgi:acetoin utilization protein AcuB